MNEEAKNSIELICDTILTEANNQRNTILMSAKNEATAKLQAVKDDIEWATKETQEKVENEYNSEIERAKNRGKNAINKLILAQKREIIDDIFNSIVDELCKLELHVYQNLIENLLIAYAQEEDGVSLSKDSLVDEKFITSLQVFKDRKLKFLYHKSDIKGGFVLSNAQNDTIVSFESLVDEYKEKYAYKIASELFA